MSQYNGYRPVRFDDVVPEMKKSRLSILIWTVLYLVNLGMILLSQYAFFYTVPQLEIEEVYNQVTLEDETVRSELFPDSEVLDAYPGYFFLIREGDGTAKLVRCSENCVLHRWRVDWNNAQTVGPGESRVVTMENLWGRQSLRILNGTQIDRAYYESERSTLGFFRVDQSSELMGIYLFVSVVMLLAEYLIYSQFRRIFR